MRDEAPPEYLQPYVQAARRHRGRFESLLWASRHTQQARFSAFTEAYDFTDRRVLDVGAGRGDLLAWLIAHQVEPTEYIALEAVPDLADAIADRFPDGCTVVRDDFVRNPARLFVGADVVVFSGSLNTLPPPVFYDTLRRAFDAAGDALLFNFLADPALAAAPYLHWHRKHDVEAFARTLTDSLRLLDHYLPGDCTLCLHKTTPGFPAGNVASQT